MLMLILVAPELFKGVQYNHRVKRFYRTPLEPFLVPLTIVCVGVCGCVCLETSFHVGAMPVCLSTFDNG